MTASGGDCVDDGDSDDGDASGEATGYKRLPAQSKASLFYQVPY